ncbi:hypothetical protein D9M71_315620 [compost metagenome]
MTTLLIDKLSNAFIPNAQTSELIAGDALRAVERYSCKHGGLWVGGRVTATTETLLFVPNSLNQACHEGLHPVRIPMNRVLGIKREFGWITGIVVITHSDGEFRFRCFRAKKVIEVLSAYTTYLQR